MRVARTINIGWNCRNIKDDIERGVVPTLYLEEPDRAAWEDGKDHGSGMLLDVDEINNFIVELLYYKNQYEAELRYKNENT
jgi:hypothetical protein